MDRDTFEKQWFQIKDHVRERFSKLTDEDVRQINGRYDQFIAKIQQRYGYTREEADEELRKWNFDKSFDRGAAYSHAGRDREQGSSLLKWLVFAGLPLLLLALYLANEPTRTTDTARTDTGRVDTARDTVRTDAVRGDTAASDQTLTQNIRQTLAANDRVAGIANNIRILTSNGIVTLSGTVASSQDRDSIVRLVQGTPGVRQVRNELEVSR